MPAAPAPALKRRFIDQAPAAHDTPGGPALPGSPQRLYEALLARDARFDGRLFVGVTSTGVYCRPVCRVKAPRRENCRFFGNAASAELAGFRPCLRCRPELAPGLSLADSSRMLAREAAHLIDAAVHAGNDPDLAALAARLGVTDRHLRRIFQQSHGVAPVDYLATRRLLQAKQLLTDTRWPIAQVALASGFSSVRRFNAAFAERYRLRPGDLRRDARGDGAPAPAGSSAASRPRAATRRAASRSPEAQGDGALEVRLPYRPPLDRAALLRFFERRALPGIEAVGVATLARTLALEHQGRHLAGWVEAHFEGPVRATSGTARPELVLRIAPELTPALGRVLQRARAAFDLDADPQALRPVLAQVTAALAGASPRPRTAAAGTRLPGAFDPFEVAVRVILGQQITVAAARTLARRLVEHFAAPLATPFAGLTHTFPAPATLAEAAPDALGTLGIVRQRVGALQALARAMAEGRLHLDGSAPLADTLDALRALPGVGEWTVQTIALRALAWPDAFPASDIAVLRALGARTPREAEARAEAWRPWRSYAVIRLWQSLESGT